MLANKRLVPSRNNNFNIGQPYQIHIHSPSRPHPLRQPQHQRPPRRHQMVMNRPQPPILIKPLRERKVERLHEQAHDHAHLHARELPPHAVRGPIRERDERRPVEDVPPRARRPEWRASARGGTCLALGRRSAGRGGGCRAGRRLVSRAERTCGRAPPSGVKLDRDAENTHLSAIVAPRELYGTWRGPFVGSGGASLRVSFLGTSRKRRA